MREFSIEWIITEITRNGTIGVSVKEAGHSPVTSLSVMTEAVKKLGT